MNVKPQKEVRDRSFQGEVEKIEDVNEKKKIKTYQKETESIRHDVTFEKNDLPYLSFH